MYFDETLLNDNILDALYDMRFDECTPIQAACIDPIIEGRDIMGVAQTGTGKTAAYLLPVLSCLDSGHFPEDSINCLIMAPTRELAQQIDQAMQGFGYYLDGISSVAVYGGNDGNRYYQEMEALKQGASVIIATPGRFISHMQMGNVDLSRLSYFILDEADRMLDMGFSEDILSIAKDIPKTCQTIMFSATMPDNIENLAKNLLKDPLNVKIAVSKPAEKIQQSAYVCYDPQKMPILKSLFKKGFSPVPVSGTQSPSPVSVSGTQSPSPVSVSGDMSPDRVPMKRVIIFSGKKQRVKEIFRHLVQMHVSCGEMHSDLSQAERDDIMYRFKSGEIDVLVATDIVARGIDIDDIAMVINYDVPHDVEDYVHRIGRTARAERDGIAITLVSKDDIWLFKKIEQFLERTITKNPMPPEVGEGPEYTSAPGAGKGSRQHHGTRSGHHTNSKHNNNKSNSKHYDRKRKQKRTPQGGLPDNSQRKAD